MSERKYLLAPLATAMGLTEHGATRALRLSGSRAKRYRTEGMSWDVADRLAGAAGFHPAEIWPSWCEDSIAEAEADEAARRERRRQIARESARRRYRDPERRQVLLQRSAAYYAENRRAVLAKRRQKARGVA